MKTAKQYTFTILRIIISFFIAYIISSFIYMDFNILHWSIYNRSYLIISALIIYLVMDYTKTNK